MKSARFQLLFQNAQKCSINFRMISSTNITSTNARSSQIHALVFAAIATVATTDAVPPVHVVSNHVEIVDTDKLTTANGGTFTLNSARLSSQSR